MTNRTGPKATEVPKCHLEVWRGAGVLPLLRHKQRLLAFGMWGCLWELAGEVDGFSSVGRVQGHLC